MAAAIALAMQRSLNLVLIGRTSLAWLRDDIDQCGRAALDDRDRFAQHGPELSGILDWPSGPDAHALGDGREVDERIVEQRADQSVPFDAALAAQSHALQVHDFLVIRAIVMHHRKQRNLVM